MCIRDRQYSKLNAKSFGSALLNQFGIGNSIERTQKRFDRELWDSLIDRQSLLAHRKSDSLVQAASDYFSAMAKAYGAAELKSGKSKSLSAKLVQGQLLPNEAYIECVKFRVPWDNEHRYAAWLITKDATALVNLGSSDQVEANVEVVIREIDRAIAYYTNPAANDEADVDAWTQVASPLAESVLAPIVSRLPSGINRIIVSPDAALWNVPWAALPIDNDFAIKKFAFEIVLDSEGLASLRKKPNFKGRAAIFHSADFDASRAEVIEAGAKTISKTEAASLLSGSFFRQGLPGRAEALPLTKIEADNSIAPLRVLTGSEPESFSGAKSSKLSFYQIYSPKILLIGTHGFFLPKRITLDPDRSHEFNSSLGTCGLMLAGANSRCDGLLATNEVVELSLIHI